jgi:hypothetical protein
MELPLDSPDVIAGDTPLGAEGGDEEANLSEEQVFDEDLALSTSGEEDTPTDIAAQFLCIFCDKPQSVGTQPTATFRGRWVCYK